MTVTKTKVKTYKVGRETTSWKAKSLAMENKLKELGVDVDSEFSDANYPNPLKSKSDIVQSDTAKFSMSDTSDKSVISVSDKSDVSEKKIIEKEIEIENNDDDSDDKKEYTDEELDKMYNYKCPECSSYFNDLTENSECPNCLTRLKA